MYECMELWISIACMGNCASTEQRITTDELCRGISDAVSDEISETKFIHLFKHKDGFEDG